MKDIFRAAFDESKLPLAISILLLASMASRAAVCSSHFYNNSDVAWTISGPDAGTTQLPVAPNSTVEIHWSAVATHVVIGRTIKGRLDQREFLAHRLAGCYVIVTREPTGLLRFNQPAMGDITTVQVGKKQQSH